ncbi:YfbU family protein [Pseudomonas sp. MWU349]|uniref:YfbU family protein n=1 Tax=Pseudomonas sp. MWU349 TaxID=2802572 RepID=UPI001B32D3EB|nr:YfbU family protein [Pseudomonas sp. MWU349]
MDKLQLLILKNQYEILSHLQPQRHDHKIALEAIDRGYEYEIENLIDRAVTEPVSMQICEEVRAILGMYRELQNSLAKAGASEELKREALFPGFDGNEESAHYSYATFILDEKGEFQGIASWEQNTWNSHMPMLRRYRAMLGAFHTKKAYPHSVEFIEKVLQAGDD